MKINLTRLLHTGRLTCIDCIPKKRKLNAERRSGNHALKKKCGELEARVAQLEAENQHMRTMLAASGRLGNTTAMPGAAPVCGQLAATKDAAATQQNTDTVRLQSDVLNNLMELVPQQQQQQQDVDSFALSLADPSLDVEFTMHQLVGDSIDSTSHIGSGSAAANIEEVQRIRVSAEEDEEAQKTLSWLLRRACLDDGEANPALSPGLLLGFSSFSPDQEDAYQAWHSHSHMDAMALMIVVYTVCTLLGRIHDVPFQTGLSPTANAEQLDALSQQGLRAVISVVILSVTMCLLLLLLLAWRRSHLVLKHRWQVYRIVNVLVPLQANVLQLLPMVEAYYGVATPAVQESYKNPGLVIAKLCVRHVLLILILDPPVSMLCGFQLAQAGLLAATSEVAFRELKTVLFAPIVICWAAMLVANYRRRREFLQILAHTKEEILRHAQCTTDDEKWREAEAQPGTWFSFASSCVARGNKIDCRLAIVFAAWALSQKPFYLTGSVGLSLALFVKVCVSYSPLYCRDAGEGD